MPTKDKPPSSHKTPPPPRVRTASSKHTAITNDSESVAKIRASRSARFSRHPRNSKFLIKTDEEEFQIRKSLNAYVREELQLQGRKTYFQRVYILARNFDPPDVEKQKIGESVYSAARCAKQRDFRVFFQRQMDRIFAICNKNKCTHEILSGLFICMDTYTYMLIEGDEDMMGDFFYQLSLVHDNLWMDSKVFMVEDKIGKTHFSVFHCHRSPVININEKCPPSTTDSPEQMRVQHFKIRDKMKKVAETFAHHIQQSEESDVECTLPADPYNKLLPEVQRIDLVLNCHRFYRSVKDFALTYQNIPTFQDEDALIWPIQDNYTPMGIFDRSAYDVNLTFADSNKGEKDEHYDEEENGGNEEVEVK